MTITKEAIEGGIVLHLEGRLDTTTAPVLEKTIRDIPGKGTLVLDFKALVYISSAGLRTLLFRQKEAAVRGPMILTNVSSDIMEVFDITGFSAIFTIQ